MNLKVTHPHSGLARLLALSVFVSAALVILLNFKSTAVTWPSSDNLPEVCRLLQSNCLTEDFFTNASSGITPRLPYAYFLSKVTKIAHNGIGGGLAVIKALLLTLLPVAVSLFFIAAIKTHAENKDKDKDKEQWVASPANLIAIISAPLFVFFLQGKSGAILSVAWWAPLTFEATAQNLSLLLTISGFLLIWLDRKGTGVIFIALGAVFHPAIGLFSSALSCILLCNFTSFKDASRLIYAGLGTSFIGAIFVKIFFEADNTISAQDFVRIYAFEAHPSHYIPSQFGTLSGIPWFWSFAVVSIGLLFATVILYKINSAAWKSSFLAFIAYSSSVLIQFIFVETNQIKLIATLGPCRFTMFGPWFLFVFYFIAILKFINGNQGFVKLSSAIYQNLASARWIYIFASYVILGLAVVSYAYKSSDFDLPDDAKMLATFASEQTDSSDVFVLPPNAPRVEFPLKTGRGIFFGNGFPFSEKYFHEWEERKAIVNGRNAEIVNLPGTWIGEKYANHYRSLLPKDFLNAAKKYKIDWVVIEADYSKNFSGCRADFHSPKYNAYSLLTLDECTR
jgi:hypothetical protein